MGKKATGSRREYLLLINNLFHLARADVNFENVTFVYLYKV